MTTPMISTEAGPPLKTSGFVEPPPLFSLLEQLAVPDIPDISRLPTQDDLPSDDGVPMETYRHKRQMDLLIDVLDAWLVARGDGFAGGNMFLYYSMRQVKRNNFLGPDFFVALDVPLGERKSWVCWEEGKVPDVVVELLSASTAKQDKTTKKDLYARVIKIPEYFWYHPWDSSELAGFVLHGSDYVPIPADSEGRLYSSQLNLFLGRWEGVYKGIHAVWVRWFTPEGEMLPSADEIAEAVKLELKKAKADIEKVKADAEKTKAVAETAKAEAEMVKAELTTAQQRALNAEARAEQLAAKLRALGVDI